MLRQPLVLAAALLAAAAAVVAQQTGQDDGSTLPELVGDLPPCAYGCFITAADTAGCDTTDLDCLCNTNATTFISNMGPCLVTSACSSNETSGKEEEARVIRHCRRARTMVRSLTASPPLHRSPAPLPGDLLRSQR